MGSEGVGPELALDQAFCNQTTKSLATCPQEFTVPGVGMGSVPMPAPGSVTSTG